MEVAAIFKWHEQVWKSHLNNIRTLGEAHATFLNVGMLAQNVYLNALNDSGVKATDARQAILQHKRKKSLLKKREW